MEDVQWGVVRHLAAQEQPLLDIGATARALAATTAAAMAAAAVLSP